MKTISAVDLRKDLEGIVKCLKRGERMALTYRGEKVADLVPTRSGPAVTPLEALERAQAITLRDPDYLKKAEEYLREVREDRRAWGERSP